MTNDRLTLNDAMLRLGCKKTKFYALRKIYPFLQPVTLGINAMYSAKDVDKFSSSKKKTKSKAGRDRLFTGKEALQGDKT